MERLTTFTLVVVCLASSALVAPAIGHEAEVGLWKDEALAALGVERRTSTGVGEEMRVLRVAGLQDLSFSSSVSSERPWGFHPFDNVRSGEWAASNVGVYREVVDLVDSAVTADPPSFELQEDGGGGYFASTTLTTSLPGLQLELLPMCRLQVDGLPEVMEPGVPYRLSVRFDRRNEIPGGRMSAIFSAKPEGFSESSLALSVPLVFPEGPRSGLRLLVEEGGVMLGDTTSAEVFVESSSRVLSVEGIGSWPDWVDLDLVSPVNSDSLTAVSLTLNTDRPSVLMSSGYVGRIRLELADSSVFERGLTLRYESLESCYPDSILIVSQRADISVSVISDALGSFGTLSHERCGWTDSTAGAFGLEAHVRVDESNGLRSTVTGQIASLPGLTTVLGGRPLFLLPSRLEHIPGYAKVGLIR